MQNDFADNHASANSTSSSTSSNNTSFLDFRSNPRRTEKVDLSFGNLMSHSDLASDSQDECSAENESFFEDPNNSASLIKWTSLNNIYPVLGAYGGPTCIYPTNYCSVLGTSKGPLLIFSMKQLLINKLVPQISSDITENYLRSPVKAIVVSADGTHLAASYESGDIFLWNLNTSDDTKSIKQDKDGDRAASEPLRAILHITDHRGHSINGLGFVGCRHTAVIVSDSSGEIVYHSGFRTRLWSLTYNSKQVLSISLKEKLLCSRTAPYVEESASIHMVGVLTSTTFAIISTNPHLTTLFLEKLPSKLLRDPLTNSSLSWYSDASRIALSINRHVSVFDLRSSAYPGSIISKKKTWEFTEPVLSLQWVSEQLLGVLTISHQFLMVDVSDDFKVVSKLDLLIHDLLIPPNTHFAVHDSRIFLLTHYTLKIGKYATWLDITLNRVQRGDYIGALKIFEALLRQNLPLSCLIKLEQDQKRKEKQLEQPFYNLALAALRFLLQQEAVEYARVYQLLSVILRIIKKFHNEASGVEQVDVFLEQSMEFFDEGKIGVFYEVLANTVLEGSLNALPPAVFKGMLNHYANAGRTAFIEEMVLMLDPEKLDIDLAVKLCKKYRLFDILTYIWNKIFHDYTTPFVDAIYKLSCSTDKCSLFDTMAIENMERIFDYLSFVLTGRQYPQNQPIAPKDEQQAKMSLYYILFSGICIEWPLNGEQKLYTQKNSADEPAFPYFNLLLTYDAVRLLSMLNEVFEDSFLNEGPKERANGNFHMHINRQYIVDMMLDIMKEKKYCTISALLAIFISSNIAKYPQFIRLSNQALERVISTICNVKEHSLEIDSQRALESLLTVYTPINPDAFIVELKDRKYNRLLFTIYKKTKRYVDLLLLTLESDDTRKEYNKDITAIIRSVLAESKKDPLAHSDIVNIIRDKFPILLEKLGPQEAVILFDEFDPQVHQFIGAESNGKIKQIYLENLFGSVDYQSNDLGYLRDLYVELSCRYKDKKSLLTWLNDISLKNIDTQHILNLLIADRNYEGAALIHGRLQNNTLVVEDMLHAIKCWFEMEGRNYDTLDRYLHIAIEASNASTSEKQCNWTKLIACLITLYGNHETNIHDREACNEALQKLFVSLALSDTSDKEERVHQFWSILTNALEHQEVILRKAEELKDLLLDIFTAYKVEEHMSRIILKIIEDSSVCIVRSYTAALQKGWSIRNDECEVCGKKLWGMGLSTMTFNVWENRRRGMEDMSRDIEKLSIIVFTCHHGFHKQCLKNLGQHKDRYSCLLCDDT